MRLYQTSKSVLSFRKEGVKSFLNGLTSNTMDAPRNAFLTIHGRIVATFDQLSISDDEVLIIVEKNFSDDILEHIDRYIKLGGVKVEPRELNVYFDLDGGYTPLPGEYAVEQKCGQLILTAQALDTNVSDEQFIWFRLAHNIPLQGMDYADEMILNVSLDEFVSFTKGCFLGQEPVAKVYNRSKPTWRLVVKRLDQCSEEEQLKLTSKAADPDTGLESGFVFERNQS